MRRDSRRYNFSRFSMLWIALAFCAGILVGGQEFFDARTAAASACASGIAAVLLRNRTASAAIVLAAFVFAGAFAAIVESQSVGPDRVRVLIDSGAVPTAVPLAVEGTLSRPPELAPDGFSLTVEAERIGSGASSVGASGQIRLWVEADPNESAHLDYGSRIRTVAKLRRDEQFLNPGVIRQREVLDQLQLDAFGSIRAASSIEQLSGGDRFPLAAFVYRRRTRAINLIRENMSAKAAGVMIASLLGNDQFLDKPTADLFREGGTYHLLVISGLHITVIGALILLFLRRLTWNRWVHFVVSAAALWIYALAVGGESPVTRAALMFTILLLGYAVYRQANSLNLLGLTALVLLVVRPSNLFSPSFQLTFASVMAVFGLVVPLLSALREIGTWTPTSRQPFPPIVPRAVRAFCEWLYWDPAVWGDAARANIWSGTLAKGASVAKFTGTFVQRLLVHVFEVLAASAILQIALLPMSILYFHRISFVGILNNVWAGVFLGMESLLTIVGILLSAASERVARGFFGLAEICNGLLFASSSFEKLGALSFRVPEYSGAGRAFYVLTVAALVGFAIALHRWGPFELKRSTTYARPIVGMLLAALAVSVGAAVFHPLSSPAASGRLRVDFLDVGQGDSALVTFPNGETMLIDAGGTPDFRDKNDSSERFEADRRGIGETVVSEYLWHRGYANIDYLMASHSDADHVGGMADVAANFRIGRAIFGRVDPTPAATAMLAVLEKRQVPIETLSAGDAFAIAGVRVDVLNPLRDDVPGRGSTNDASIVLRLSFGERSILMTGDIEEDAERRLTIAPETLRADVVKVAHHGSKTSSTEAFVQAVSPALAVISVGRRSPYGHPHESVVDNWRSAGTDVITTGERGTVTITTDGKEVTMTTYLPR